MELFTPGEFLLADGGYTLSPYVLIPFAHNKLDVDGWRHEFNQKISRARIVVEWVFAQLKSCFPSLKRMGAAKDIDNIYRAIEAMMIIHNICHQLWDTPSDRDAQLTDDDDLSDNPDEDANDSQEAHEILENGNSKALLVQGQAFREHCVDILCPL
ncbi:hypothetical protein FRC07_007085 [Ceratobasidium sp. 392]|nr:hypothetical protein FRC07_007085 [Ceratobasidium sp. 392]